MTDTLAAYDFDLPVANIALRPAKPRDSARLLLVNRGEAGALEDRIVSDLPSLLRPGDALVFNDTKSSRRGSGAAAPVRGRSFASR